MQSAIRTASSAQTTLYPGRRAHVVCRMAQPDARGRNSGEGPSSSSWKSASFWLTPVSMCVAGYALTKADPSNFLQEFLPLAAVLLSPVAAVWLDKAVDDWRAENAIIQGFVDPAIASKILDIEVQEQNTAGEFHTISAFKASCTEMLRATRNNTALLKPFLMQCSEALRHHKQDELEVFAVDPEGDLGRFQEGKLYGLFFITDKFVVRMLRAIQVHSNDSVA